MIPCPRPRLGPHGYGNVDFKNFFKGLYIYINTYLIEYGYSIKIPLSTGMGAVHSTILGYSDH